MTVQKMSKSILIQAPAEKVWQVLISPGYIHEWYTAFGEGIEAKTDWQLGSKATFTDQKGDGIFGRIVTHEPNKKISIEYDGFMAKGQEDFTSEAAQSTKGTHETYTLMPSGNGTELFVELDVDDQYFDMMAGMWDNALVKIKELSEK